VAARLGWVTIQLVHAPSTVELLDRLRASLSGCPAVLEAYLFGSVAREEAQPHSDVDIAVFVDASEQK
jgi:predicted nucleotidyltransferase